MTAYRVHVLLKVQCRHGHFLVLLQALRMKGGLSVLRVCVCVRACVCVCVWHVFVSVCAFKYTCDEFKDTCAPEGSVQAMCARYCCSCKNPHFVNKLQLQLSSSLSCKTHFCPAGIDLTQTLTCIFTHTHTPTHTHTRAHTCTHTHTPAAAAFAAACHAGTHSLLPELHIAPKRPTAPQLPYQRQHAQSLPWTRLWPAHTIVQVCTHDRSSMHTC